MFRILLGLVSILFIFRFFLFFSVVFIKFLVWNFYSMRGVIFFMVRVVIKLYSFKFSEVGIRFDIFLYFFGRVRE